MKQIKTYIKALAVLSLGIVLLSCEKEQVVMPPFEYNPTESFDTTTILGKKIYEIHQKYESRIIYNWDSYFIGNDAHATPPSYEKVYDFILLMEEIWFNRYHNEDFLRKNLPREIVLTAANINYGEENGSNFGAAGQADSKYRIIVGTVNSYSPDLGKEDMISYRFMQEKVLHHEFSHILNKRYSIPDEFKAVSKGLYLINTHYSSLDLLDALNKGFIRTYGASNEHEDFATMAEEICTRSEETLLYNMWQKWNEDTQDYEPVGIAAFEKVMAKYKIVKAYYEDLGIDVQSIGNESEAARNKMIEELQNQ